MADTKTEDVKELDPKTICGTALTVDLIENVIKAKISTKSKIVKIQAEEFGTGGQGFLSVMARVNLTWEPADQNLPNCVVAKIPTASKLHIIFGQQEDGQKLIETLTGKLHMIHNCEVSVYELFSRFETTDTPCPVPLPYVYGVKKMIDVGEHTHPAYIIMDDLTVHNALIRLVHMEKPTEQQLNEIICGLGKLHGWSLNHMSVVKQVLEPVDFEEYIKEMMAGFDKKWDETLVTLNTPEYVEFLGQDLIDQIPSFRLGSEIIKDLMHIHERHKIPSVLCHGDMHINNCMFQKDADGNAAGKLAAVYDWQIAHLGGPLDDVIKIVQFTVDVQNYTKLEWRQNLVKTYYEAFKSVYKGDMPFTLDKLTEYFEETYLTNMRLSVPFLPRFVKIFSGANESLGLTEETAVKLLAKYKIDAKAQLVNVVELMAKKKLERGISEIKI